MKRKLIAFLIVCTIMLTGCGSGGGSSSDSKKLDNNSKVTKSNFKKFPTTDGKLFEYTLADDGDVNHIKITGIKTPDDDKLKVVVVPKTITVKTVDGNVKKTVVAVSGLSNLDKAEAIVLPNTVRKSVIVLLLIMTSSDLFT